eukprot:6203868-Pleurochrysis_carterae.AAC.2
MSLGAPWAEANASASLARQMDGNKPVDLKVGPLLDAIGKSLRIGEARGPRSSQTLVHSEPSLRSEFGAISTCARPS